MREGTTRFPIVWVVHPYGVHNPGQEVTGILGTDLESVPASVRHVLVTVAEQRPDLDGSICRPRKAIATWV